MSSTTVRMILFAILVGFSCWARSEPSDLNQVDSILDRLEKRLLDQEADGLSFGEKEAIELRDGDKKRWMGKGVSKAVANISKVIAPELLGKEALDQAGIDQAIAAPLQHFCVDVRHDHLAMHAHFFGKRQ